MVAADAASGATTIDERTITKAAPNFFKLTRLSNSSRPAYHKQRPRTFDVAIAIPTSSREITTVYSDLKAVWQTFVSLSLGSLV